MAVVQGGVLTLVVVGGKDQPLYEADFTGPKEVGALARLIWMWPALRPSLTLCVAVRSNKPSTYTSLSFMHPLMLSMRRCGPPKSCT
jgi:hypothetical protein